MYTDLVEPAKFIIWIVKVFGLWRLDNRWEFLYRIYSIVVHLIFTFLNSATIWLSLFTTKDLEVFTNSLYMALAEVALIAKVINMFYLNKEAVNFFEFVEDAEVAVGKSPNEKRIFREAHITFDAVAKFYILGSACVLVLCFTVVAFDSRNVLPYPAWMPFELEAEKFWYAFIFQFLGNIVNCLSNVSVDMLQCYYMHHLSVIYKVICYRLSRIGYDISESISQEDANRIVFRQLKETINAHQFAKEVTIKCGRLTSFPFFVQVLLSALVLCFTGYQLVDISPLQNPVRFLGTAGFLFVIGFQIFLPCYYAHQVTVKSGRLSEALYDSNWVALPKKSRKLICMYMGFLRDPIYIRTGKFFTIGIPIFAKTINNAYSYFAVLIRMKK